MQKRARIHTVLYGDQQVEPAEIDLLHTPALQRLYDLHQLGLTDRVYPDASHARLHHVIGVLEQVDKLVTAITRNLKRDADRQPLRFGEPSVVESLKTSECAEYVERRRRVARIMGLLHDLTHAPFGHTLEDEIEFLDTSHDNPDRQADAFYRLLCQYIAWLARDNDGRPAPDRRNRRAAPRSSKADPLHSAFAWDTPAVSRSGLTDSSIARDLAQYLDGPDLYAPPARVEQVAAIASQLLKSDLRPHRMAGGPGPVQLRRFLRELNVAMQGLLHLQLLHKDQHSLKWMHVPRQDEYPFQVLIRLALESSGTPLRDEDYFRPYRDAFLLDIIGNTICADLLDYAKRDSFFAGLKLDYDADRIIENFTLVSCKFRRRELPKGSRDETFVDPFDGDVLRTAITLFTHKLRTDVPGQVMGLLQARFHIHERALFHPTKCVAGAMLGSALQLLGWPKLPEHLLHTGDAVFLYQLTEGTRLGRDLLQLPASADQLFAVDGAPVQALTQLDRIPRTGVLLVAREIVETVRRSIAGGSTAISVALENLDAALRLLDRLAARRYHRPIFRVLPNAQFQEAMNRADKDKTRTPAEIVAEVFLDAANRFKVERQIEDQAQLPRGSVVIHCPEYTGPTKISNILVLAFDTSGREQVRPLREIQELQNGIFTKHQVAIIALEEMYRSMWRLIVSVAPPDHVRHQELGLVISSVLRDSLVETHAKFYAGLKVPNDPTMERQLELAEKAAMREERESEAGPDGTFNQEFVRTAVSAIKEGIAKGKLLPPADWDGWPPAIADALQEMEFSKGELEGILKRLGLKTEHRKALRLFLSEFLSRANKGKPPQRHQVRRDMGRIYSQGMPALKVARSPEDDIRKTLEGILDQYGL